MLVQGRVGQHNPAEGRADEQGYYREQSHQKLRPRCIHDAQHAVIALIGPAEWRQKRVNIGWRCGRSRRMVPAAGRAQGTRAASISVPRRARPIPMLRVGPVTPPLSVLGASRYRRSTQVVSATSSVIQTTAVSSRVNGRRTPAQRRSSRRWPRSPGCAPTKALTVTSWSRHRCTGAVVVGGRHNGVALRSAG